MRTRSTHSTEDITLKNEDMEVRGRHLLMKKGTPEKPPDGDENDDVIENDESELSSSRVNESNITTETQGMDVSYVHMDWEILLERHLA